MRYWETVDRDRLNSLEKFLCGVCQRGWVLKCVLLETGATLWVCEECDAVWLQADEVELKAAPANPELVLPQIMRPAAGVLSHYVRPYDGTEATLDWEQIRLADDVT
ncbi:hypothetical protein Aca07nite_10920 [Actinoplanes capillaceus]|uniref:Transcription factor zinc-finger domain-containing protein n=1 Tax=Actinoplanes campanulatus TaxID=113559 RepID=A0ABQ3WCQ5_9ACTN|nr:hypothetical protein [Actinoplanes capillaceus]GID43817.1 hypothetical protein Aca07nite_10920 [Actinoplanes capillaceus]